MRRCDLFEDVEAQRRRFFAGFQLELEGPVAGADGDRQGVDTGLLDEILDLLGLGVGRLFCLDIILDTGQHAEFPFDRDVKLMRVFDDFFGQGNVLVVRQVRTVDHDRGEAVVDAGLADLEGITMVEVQADRQVHTEFLGHLDRAHRHVAQHGGIGIVASALADLDNDR